MCLLSTPPSSTETNLTSLCLPTTPRNELAQSTLAAARTKNSAAIADDHQQNRRSIAICLQMRKKIEFSWKKREWGQTGFDVECTCNHKIAIQLEWLFHVFSISNIFCRNYSELSLVLNSIFSFYYFASYIWFYDGSPNTLYSLHPWSTFLWSPYASRAYNRGITCFHLFFTYIVDQWSSNIQHHLN